MNIIYDIINTENKQILFNYAIIFIIFIYISVNLNFNMQILVGLFFASIIVYYWYSYRTIHNLSKINENENKFKLINSNTNTLKDDYIAQNTDYKTINNPEIVDFIFYMEDIKKYNISIYNNIIILFENFSKLYNACLIDNTFIDDYYNTLNNIKYNIIENIGKYNYIIKSPTYAKKINELQNKAEILLNKYIDELIILYKKNIKIKGYNNSTKILDTTNILPFNYLDTNMNVLF